MAGKSSQADNRGSNRLSFLVSGKEGIFTQLGMLTFVTTTDSCIWWIKNHISTLEQIRSSCI